MKKLLYGAAYYDEYMPYDRLQQDVAMMKKAGINTVRIAESTWSTCEPQEVHQRRFLPFCFLFPPYILLLVFLKIIHFALINTLCDSWSNMT